MAAALCGMMCLCITAGLAIYKWSSSDSQATPSPQEANTTLGMMTEWWAISIFGVITCCCCLIGGGLMYRKRGAVQAAAAQSVATEPVAAAPMEPAEPVQPAAAAPKSEFN